MKLAYVLHQFPAISETFHLRRILALIAQGIDVTVIAHYPDLKAIEIHQGYSIHNLKNHTFYSGMPENNLMRLLQAAKLLIGGECSTLVSTIKTIPYGLHNAFNLSRFYRRLSFKQSWFDFDIVHAGYGTIATECLPLHLIVQSKKPKLVTSFMGSDLNVILKTRGARFYRHLFTNGDLFLPVSNTLRESLLAAGVPAEKTIVLRNGIDLIDFNFQKKKTTTGPISILSVGRLDEVKGFAYSIEAIKYLNTNGIDFRYVIVGDGPLKSQLQKKVDDLGLNSIVRFEGNVNEVHLKHLLRNASVLVAPSIITENGSEEGLPTIIVEALALGVPVVSTITGGIPEIIKNGSNGILVPPRDARNLADAIIRIVTNHTFSETMALMGRKFVEENYDQRLINEQLVNLYKSIS